MKMIDKREKAVNFKFNEVEPIEVCLKVKKELNVVEKEMRLTKKSDIQREKKGLLQQFDYKVVYLCYKRIGVNYMGGDFQ